VPDGEVIYTIGYGARNVDEMVAVLRQYGIQYLVDVRSQPYSKYKPEFSKAALERRLSENGIRYVFMGDTLGGRPSDKAYYTNDGKVDYVKLKDALFFQEGIARLRTALDKQLRLALMCSEGKPQECHRTKLIGQALKDIPVEVWHIDEQDRLCSQDEAMSKVMGGQPPLFDIAPGVSTSRKDYS
jgi:uncharacterized protein (DUF488 family)